MNTSAKLFCIITVALLNSCGSTPPLPQSDAKGVSHSLLDSLLNAYVDSTGSVDYVGLQKDSTRLKDYLDLLGDSAPSVKWKKNEKLAYWINAYNAVTLKLITDNLPLESITDLHPTLYVPGKNTVWHRKLFKVGQYMISLDHIEHGILRKEFDEPRIHFAIVCASRSCPKLRNSAYVSDSLEFQLDQQTQHFLLDTTLNKLSVDHLQLSKIFKWFKEDFTRKGSLKEFLQNQSDVQIDENAKVEYLDYNWALNGDGGIAP